MEFRTALLFLELAVYFVLMIIIGIVTKKWVTSMSDFFCSGRELSALTMGLGLAGIMFSGATLPAISGFAITHSLWVGSLYMWGWAAGILVFGRFMAPAIRRSGVFTLPEWAEVRYDSKTRSVVAVATSVAAFGALFAQVVGLGNNITAITGIPYWATTLFVVVLCTFYMYAGGFWALSVSDMSHMTVVMIAFVITLGYLFISVGNPFFVAANSPGADHRIFSFFGKVPPDFAYSLKFPSFPSLLFGWFLTMMGCQYYWMRAIGGRNEKAVKKGYYISAIITFLFGSTMLALFGTYALYMFGEGNVKSGAAFGMIVKSLPVGLDGLLFVALVAGCMSTFSTALLGVASPITRDIYQRLVAPKADAKHMTKASRIITLSVAVISYLFALVWKTGAAHALAVMWAFSCPTAAVLGLGYIWKRVTIKASFWGELIGLIVTLGWYLSGKSGVMHPMWVGLLVTLVIVVILTLLSKPKYYGEADYKPAKPSNASGLAQSNVALFREYQDTQARQAMCDLMRPCIGTKKYKDMLERKHNSGLSVARLAFPHFVAASGPNANIVVKKGG